MMRRSGFLWFAIFAAVVTGLYVVKDRVHALESQMREVEREIAENRAAIHVLRAEWAHLNRPSRLEDLGSRLLGLEPVAPQQVVTVDELGDRLAAASRSTVAADETAGQDWLRTILSGLKGKR